MKGNYGILQAKLQGKPSRLEGVRVKTTSYFIPSPITLSLHTTFVRCRTVLAAAHVSAIRWFH